MANPDRLERPRRVLPLARAQRRAHARRLRARVRGRGAALRRVRGQASSSGCTSCRATARSSPCRRWCRAARSGSTTRTSTPATTCATRRCPRPRGEERAAQPGRADLRPGAGPLQAAVGAVAGRPRRRGPLRADLQDPPRARRRRLGRRHLDRAVRPRARPAGARARAALVPAARAEPGACCWPRRRRARARRRWTPRAARSAPPAIPSAPWPAAARRSPGSRRWRAAGLAGAPPSPLNVRIGSHRRFAWVDADLERFKAIKSALGGTVNDVVLAAVTRRAARVRDPPRPRPRGHGAQGDGAGLRARGRRARRARQPRRRDVRAAAALRRRTPGERFDIVHEAMGGLKESGQAVGAEVLTRLAGLRRADRARPGVAAADPPALLQPRRDQRARARSSRSTCRAAGCAPSTRRSR